MDWPAQIDPTQHIAWLKKFWDAILPHTDGFYTNDVVDETQKQIDENYLGNYPRLLALKNQIRPDEPVPAERERRAEGLTRYQNGLFLAGCAPRVAALAGATTGIV